MDSKLNETKTTKRSQRVFLPGYFETLSLSESKETYKKKLEAIDGCDPYEIPRNDWLNDLESWPSVTYIHVGMNCMYT